MIAAFLLAFMPVVSPVSAPQSPQAPARTATAATGVTGTVTDSAGAVIPGATVIARTSAGSEQRTITGPDGKFTISLAAPFDLTVLAGGFAEKKQPVTAAGREALDIVLSPASHAEQVLVTPTRT